MLLGFLWFFFIRVGEGVVVVDAAIVRLPLEVLRAGAIAAAAAVVPVAVVAAPASAEGLEAVAGS